MYLKSLEMVGFKSFATKTRLVFEPVMTCVVGPNGCGKSNISDAIRWVLGEQSAKAMRGSKMQDCIFNGTDNRKPMGMAEVSVTFADCEKALETDYSEVTVTRRVFRSGEGQYFINKTPCRLKDIQRLFMDTGIGTSSYSFMEQGRIDQILSSRPEDRRTVFEEASGITKFKADKKEALRKLEHTEANLLRLADVIREVKRQIGSLQRQAGKARRYKAGREELKGLDIYITRKRIEASEREIKDLEAKIEDHTKQLEAAEAEVRELESNAASLRESMTETDREISKVTEAGLQAQSRLDHTHELIHMNRQRVEEYQQWSERDSREISETRRQLDDKTGVLEDLSRQQEAADKGRRAADAELKNSTEKFTAHQQEMEQTRARIQQLRDESIETESVISKLENQLVELDSRQRSAVLQRERLSAEKTQLMRTAEGYSKRQASMGSLVQQLAETVARYEKAVDALDRQLKTSVRKLRDMEQASSDLKSQSAATQAKIDFLDEAEAAHDDFPKGSRLLLDESNPLSIDPESVLGALASHIDVEPEYRVALESCLRAWLDAVLVKDGNTAMGILKRLETDRRGAARLLALDAPPPAEAHSPDTAADRLIDHVSPSEQARPVVNAMIGDVVVVAGLDAVPDAPSDSSRYVTRTGALVEGNGCLEFWMSEGQAPTLLARKQLLSAAQKRQQQHQQELERNKAAMAVETRRQERIERALQRVRVFLDRQKRTLAQKEGESQIVDAEAKDANDRLETVTWELNALTSEDQSGTEEKEQISAQLVDLRARRERITSDVSSQSKALQQLEMKHSELQSELTEQRIHAAGLSQKTEHLTAQCDAVRSRIKELNAEMEGRSAGIMSYKANIEKLTHDIRDAEAQLTSLQESVTSNKTRAESLRKNRDKQAEEIKALEASLAQKRAAQESLRGATSKIEIRLTECRMRRENTVERITSEYNMTFDQVMEEPAPEWDGEEPETEQIETRIAELRTKLEAMGPVNLVAIDEYKELEERYAFLTAQEQDLVKAKQQLMDMIRKINRTTTEMFSKTFDQVNTNFQDMFRRLFNGGSAKLVLVNEEDVLECGIEIIARPPGKRLQNVSLLSGGERTMTAVALLFAIYMIKPSPFCLLDELDAALDDSNIGRFAGVLKTFTQQSQFLVITHNRQTIAAASALYGVTMPERGISKLVSMKFKEYEEKGAKQLAPAR